MGAFSSVRLRLWWERAFWVVPLVGVIAGAILNAVVATIDDLVAEATGGSLHVIAASQASQLMSAIGGGMITFTGFVFSFVVLILQFGSSQYSPRTVSYFLRAKSTRRILAVFLATITFTFLGLLDISSGGREDFTPELTVLVSVGLLFASLVAFIVLLHSVGSRVRVDAVLSALGARARQLFPQRLGPVGIAGPPAEPEEAVAGGVLVRSRRAGQTVAIDAGAIWNIAWRHGLKIALLIQVGDAVTVGTPLIRLSSLERPVAAGALRELGWAVVVDQERSLRHDPFYSLRLLVDIAVRALSPGVNDPTTAVRALDEIEGVLRVIGGLELGNRRLAADGAELLLRAPSWVDVVDLALLEVVLFGHNQPQVTRRVTALVADLVHDLPDERDAALLAMQRQMVALVEETWASPELIRTALNPDRQGLGGTVSGV